MVGLATLMVPRGMSTAGAMPDVVLAEVGRELESAERAIGALQTRATSLERRVAPGQGFINAEQAVQRRNAQDDLERREEGVEQWEAARHKARGHQHRQRPPPVQRAISSEY